MPTVRLRHSKKMATVSAAVTRESITSQVDADQLVYDDIIQLENGDKVPADARLIQSVELQLEESALTGESEPVRKQVAPVSGNPSPADQLNMVFSATSVVGGRGLAVITACGMGTEIGRILQRVSEAEEEKTPLQKRLDRFGRNLGLVIICICVLVFTLSIARTMAASQHLTRIVFSAHLGP